MGDLSVEQEKQVKRLRRVLEGWRVVVLQTREVLTWQQPWHPALLLAAAALLHVLLWLLDPNVLTLVGMLGVTVNVVDFLVPLVTAQLVPAAAWSGAQEKQLEDLCKELVSFYSSTTANVAAFYRMRETRPVMYYLFSIASLLLLAWLGKSVNAGLVSLVVTCALLLTPGLLQRGYHRRFSGAVTPKKEKFVDLPAKKTLPVAPEKALVSLKEKKNI